MTPWGSPRSRLIVAAVGAALALLGCSDDEPNPRAQSEVPVITPSAPSTQSPLEIPSAPAEGGCPNQSEAANPLNRTAGPLIGDVTGEGTPERVYISLDDAGEAGCQAFVVVSETSSIVAPIEGWDPSSGVVSPRFQGLAEIDGRPGAEIIVHLAAGASTQFVGVFTGSGGTIERLTTSGTAEGSSGSTDLFAFGGSVGHLEAVDCTPDGRVVVSAAIPKGERYEVSRSFYTPSGATLELQGSDSRRAVVTLNELEDFPEFASSPFGTCPPA